MEVETLTYEEAARRSGTLGDSVVTDLGSATLHVGSNPAGDKEIVLVNAVGDSASITCD